MGHSISSLRSGITEQFSEVSKEVSKVSRPPLSGNQALQALNKAEFLDGYIATINRSPINILARSETTYMPSVHSVPIPIPPPENPWPSGQVLWMNPTADEGLPHTRAPNYICLPSNISESHLASTIRHERVHVSQRIHSEKWNKILKAVWDMTPWDGTLPEAIEARRRINPDIHGVPFFIWKRTWVPFALFKSTKKPKLNEISIAWWNAESRTVHYDIPSDWLYFFGNHPAGEHPYELAAYLVVEKPLSLLAYKMLEPRLKDLPTSDVVSI